MSYKKIILAMCILIVVMVAALITQLSAFIPTTITSSIASITKPLDSTSASKLEVKTDLEKMTEQAMTGSSLYLISRNGKREEIKSFSEQLYSHGEVSANGKNILMKLNEDGGGEARWCEYVVYNFEEDKIYKYNGIQSGYSDHTILDNNMIGYAWGQISADQESSKAIKLFDMQYKPLDLTLSIKADILTNDNGEKQSVKTATGIAYNKDTGQFVVAYAYNQNPFEQDAFSKSQIGVAIFDKKGNLLSEQLIADYNALFSPNILGLIPNSPSIIDNNTIMLGAMNKDRTYKLITLNLKTNKISELPYRYLISSYEDYYYFSEDYITTQNPQSIIAKWDNTEFKEVMVCAEEITKTGYKEPFYIEEVFLSESGYYAFATNGISPSFDGLFFFEYNSVDNPLLITELPPNHASVMIKNSDDLGILLNGKFNHSEMEMIKG